MPSSHQFALKISAFPPRIKMNLNDTVLLSVLERYHHYAYLFHKELEEEVRRKNFTFNKRTQILLATVIKENNRKLLRTLFPYLVLLALAGKLFGDEFKAMEAGLIDAIKKLQRTEPPPPPTTTTEIPMTNDQLLNGILHSFIKRSDEKEEAKRQDEQEMIYATE